jgi:rhamnogalacturonan endolyase
VYGSGRKTVWTIRLNLAKPVDGEAAFRVALAGENGMRNGLAVAVNGKVVGAIGDGSSAENAASRNTDAIRYDTDNGLWQERTLKFDATLIRAEENTMTLTVPAGSLQSVVVWEYLRLELNEK